MRKTAKCMVALTLTALAAAASAQNYPSKSIRFLVGFAPGGSTDIVARLIAQKMTDNVGQQVVVDNRAGAGGIIAAEILAKSPPDGYTILACTTGNFAIIPYLYKTVPYNADKDLLPVTQSGSLPYIIVVHPSLPVKNVKDLLAGQVVMMFDQPVSTLPHVKAGKLRVLAITSGKRFPTLQEIPTVAESG